MKKDVNWQTPAHRGHDLFVRLASVAWTLFLAACLFLCRIRSEPPLDQPDKTEKADKADKADKVEKDSKRGDVFEPTPPFPEQVRDLRHALTRLPIAAGLASILAFRARRKGTPARQAPVIQTQIILAVVGAVVMLVVGSSLARAFGIVGAAGLVRYRAKIEDPKDAGVMLSTLAVGLAAGVGLWLLAGSRDGLHSRPAVGGGVD